MSGDGDVNGRGRPQGYDESSPAIRLYRVLLRLYARSWREEYGGAMEEVFAQRHAEATRRGGMARVRFWGREMMAAFSTGLRSRMGGVRGARGEAGGGSAGLQELRHAGRRLLRSPAFTITAVATLALAVAANVSIFTLVQRVVVNPLPYGESEMLVDLEHELPGLGPGQVGMTAAMYVVYADVPTLSGIALWQQFGRTVSAGGEPERLRAARVTPDLLGVLRVVPATGRGFEERDAEPGAASVAIVSDRYRQRAFGGESPVGGTIRIDGIATEVIGVMPSSFAFPEAGIDIWMPFAIDRAAPQVGGFNYRGVGRLADGATREMLARDLDVRIARLPELYPSEIATSLVEQARMKAVPVSLKESTLGTVAGTLWVLLGSVGLVLLVACANIANLLLARSETRQRELAVRRAIGSGRRGIVAFFIAESVLLAGLGGALGTLLGWAGLRVVLAAQAVPLPRLHEVRFDASVFAFAVLLTGLAALLFTVIPLARRPASLSNALREGGRGGSVSRSGMRARAALMGVQVAFALVLLVAGGLMVRSFLTLRSIELGFDPDSALTFGIGLPSSVYPSAEPGRVPNAQREILERLSALPGVRSAAMTSCLPLEGFCYGDPLEVDGAELEPGEIPPIVTMRRVSANYFETMGVRLLRGSFFDDAAVAAGERPAIISRRLADVYFPGEDPLGRRVYPRFNAESPDWYTVVGVVNDMPTNTAMESTPVPSAYFPVVNGADPGPTARGMAFVLRTEVEPLSLLPSVRAAIRAFDPALPLASTSTLDAAVKRDGARMAFTMTLLLLASGVALLLGVIGIWGVIAYMVGQRTNEIGIRLVLGARPASISGMIIGQAGFAAALGMLAGLSVAAAGGALLESLLFRVEARDPVTFLAVTVVVGVIVFLACWVPARRAARLDPGEALRV